ncbi:hypothetical protein DDV96_05950 [Marixanthomonas spongiae]|uniref:Uncharacterized protein n=2 Tax=Marixanthomonas spongiae TaxID=2174845 RepID=A0A2U0I3Z0_9FLAO|nr:hypothetical protein DDV96_05950 [Marixanthomonas spongiae]
MLAAAKGVMEANWEDVKPYAEQEFKNLSENLQLIIRLRAENKITEEQAKLYLDIHKSSVKIVLLTIEGLGILAVEQAINAALDVVKDTVNTAIGFVLI